MIFSLLLMSFQAAPPPALPDGAGAVAGVYALHQDRRAVQGTGFFVSTDGDLLTAYHNVMDAREIQIYYRAQLYKDVTVRRIAPEYDLALLHVNGLTEDVAVLPLAKSPPDTAGQGGLTVYGWPRGLSNSRVAGSRPRTGLTSSRSLREEGRAIFAERIDLLLINTTTYNGLSGAPVVWNGRAIGVVSGSFSEGGSFSWAIPLFYTDSMQAVDAVPAEIRTWPELTLVRAEWDGLRNEVAHNPDFQDLLDGYLDAVANLKDARRDFERSCGPLIALASGLAAMKPLLLEAMLQNTMPDLLKDHSAQVGSCNQDWGPLNDAIVALNARITPLGTTAFNGGGPPTSPRARQLAGLYRDALARAGRLLERSRELQADAEQQTRKQYDSEARIRRAPGRSDLWREAVVAYLDAYVQHAHLLGQAISLFSGQSGLIATELEIVDAFGQLAELAIFPES